MRFCMPAPALRTFSYPQMWRMFWWKTSDVRDFFHRLLIFDIDINLIKRNLNAVCIEGFFDRL